ncbi:hypothetical protein T09_2779 [Trichinella sp. T9]|uniref:Uncharacterized protein n=1 Tax=Trichinella murrelli TaxID=144512 RepID=A0A0V0TT42_9BILA|nr:hypothetical protein T05_5692 [Trichinella murrelli]KRX60325.1 hypothetical protein T09_2779 [Trichinella sp. T9]
MILLCSFAHAVYCVGNPLRLQYADMIEIVIFRNYKIMNSTKDLVKSATFFSSGSSSIVLCRMFGVGLAKK